MDILKLIKSCLKERLGLDKLYILYINWKFDLQLDTSMNRSEYHILKEVFSGGYDFCFPMDKVCIIVDIGAHYGYFSLFSARKTALNSKIYAIEPSNSNFDKLSKNVQSSSIKNIVLINKAIGGNSESRIVYTAKPQNHSLFSHYIDGMHFGNNIVATSLNDFILDYNIDKIDFLKIDCEGSEHEILQNAAPWVWDKISVISMEIHDMRHCGYDHNKTINTLLDAGFKIVRSFYDSIKSPKGFNAKMVFVNSSPKILNSNCY